jgi:hypothetical protein
MEEVTSGEISPGTELVRRTLVKSLCFNVSVDYKADEPSLKIRRWEYLPDAAELSINLPILAETSDVDAETLRFYFFKSRYRSFN